MTDFVEGAQVTQISIQDRNLCVVGIIGESIYDRSEFANASKDFLYTTIKYSDIPNFYGMLKGTIRTNEFKYLNILRFFSTPDSKIFFDFKCSGECCSGSKFYDEKLTKTAGKFIKLLLKRGANVVVGDHSMGALFNNWDVSHMGPCPITIKKETTSGLFRMYGNKNNFLESVHPTLNQLGDMADTEQVEITFTNMGGTLIYSINENTIPVKLISQGYPISRTNVDQMDQMNQMDPIQIERNSQPVHCEFKLFNGKIIVSSTHWCNLSEVKSDINEEKLKSNYIRAFGREESNRMEEELNQIKSNGSQEQVKRYCSARVKDICSGSQFNE